MKLLVTVGTTEFDELVQELDCPRFIYLLEKYGFSKIYIQHGRGKYELKVLNCEDKFKAKIVVEVFRFNSQLLDLMKEVDLIIGHAGAGTVLEVISLKKPIIVVKNPSLQDNHQEELANALIAGHFCTVTIPTSVLESLDSELSSRHFNSHNRDSNLFPILQSDLFSNALNRMFGASS